MPARRIAGALVPGVRAVWIGAAVALFLGSAFLGRTLLSRTASLTGTNSVDVATVVVTAERGQRLCVRDLVVPPGTYRLQPSLAVLDQVSRPRIDARVTSPADTAAARQTSPAVALGFVSFERLDGKPFPTGSTDLCLRSRDARIAYGGAFVQRLPGSRLSTLADAPISPGDVSVRFARRTGDTRRVIGAYVESLRRADVFESPLGRAITAIAFPLLIVLIYVSIRIMARAERTSVRRLAVAAAYVTFTHGAVWAVLLHPFHGADESEHFAYVEHLSSTNEQPDRASSTPRSAYSSAQLRLMEALHHNSTILNPTSRPRWDEVWERRYDRVADGAPRTDGGGGSESATGHSPLYYFAIGLPYRVTAGRLSLPASLLLMRLLNAALAALVAALAVLVASTIFRGRHNGSAWAAGLLVGLQPVFGSVAGTVNNDTGVNLLAACLILLLVRAVQDGPTARGAAFVGFVTVALPVAKITGFALVPVVGVAAVLVMMRHGVAASARWTGIAAGTAATIAAFWIFAGSPLVGGERGALYNVHTNVPTASAPGPAAAPTTLTDRVDYFAETFLPEVVDGGTRWALPGDSAVERSPVWFIYVERGYGLFGWKDVELRPSLLRAIGLALAVGWLAALVAYGQRWRRWKDAGGVLVLLAATFSVLAFISYAYANNTVHTDAGEQGRYAFTAIVPLAVLLSAAPMAVAGRLRAAAYGLIAAAAPMLALICCVSALRGWFT